MSNSTHRNKYAMNGGWGRALLDRIRTGNVIVQPFMEEMWEVLVPYTALAAAATTKALNLNDHAEAGKEFPADVEITGAQMYVHTTLDGGATTEGTVQLGDTNDPNGLVEAVSVHEDGSGAVGWVNLPWGDEIDLESMMEAAYEPSLLLTTTSADTDALTSGLISVRIKFIPLHTPRAS